MVGLNNLFHKANRQTNLSQHDSNEHIAYIRRLYQQAKQVSQIIAYIWLWADKDPRENPKETEAALALRTYFSRPGGGSEESGENLKKLLGADPTCKTDHSDEAKLLETVFFKENLDNKDYIFPIFSKFELGQENAALGYLFEIDVNAFTGSIEDADINSPELLKMIIPYPPRPAFGQTTLDEGDLDEWISNRNSDQYFANSHYIPTSCS